MNKNQIELSVCTIGLFLGVDLVQLDDGSYTAHPYNVPTNSNEHYKLNLNSAKAILAKNKYEFNRMNKYWENIKPQSNILSSHVCKINTLHSSSTEATKANYLFVSSSECNIWLEHLSLDPNIDTIHIGTSNYSLKDIDLILKDKESTLNFTKKMKDMPANSKIPFQQTSNMYLDCMYLLHRCTNIRMLLPMESETDFSTSILGLYCSYACLDVDAGSFFSYKPSNMDTSTFIFEKKLPQVQLEFLPSLDVSGNNFKYHIHVEPSLDSLFEILDSDISTPIDLMPSYDHHFLKRMNQNQKNKKDEENLSDLINKTPHVVTWGIMIDHAINWRRKRHIIELFCLENTFLDSIFLKFDKTFKSKIALERGIEMKLIHNYCLDTMGRIPFMNDGPHINLRVAYMESMSKLLALQGENISEDLNEIKTNQQHKELVMSKLKKSKGKPQTLKCGMTTNVTTIKKRKVSEINKDDLDRFRLCFYYDPMCIAVIQDILNSLKKMINDLGF